MQHPEIGRNWMEQPRLCSIPQNWMSFHALAQQVKFPKVQNSGGWLSTVCQLGCKWGMHRWNFIHPEQLFWVLGDQLNMNPRLLASFAAYLQIMNSLNLTWCVSVFSLTILRQVGRRCTVNLLHTRKMTLAPTASAGKKKWPMNFRSYKSPEMCKYL